MNSRNECGRYCEMNGVAASTTSIRIKIGLVLLVVSCLKISGVCANMAVPCCIESSCDHVTVVTYPWLDCVAPETAR